MAFTHEYPDFTLDVTLSLPSKGVTVLFGASGSGKTTLLRCLAGLERARRGELSWGAEIWQDAGTFLPTHRRPIGYVFQEASLLPHLSVEGNLQYALRRAGGEARGRGEQASSTQERSENGLEQPAQRRVLALLGIDSLLARRPDQLSGGERQRVAIARALMTRPRLLLMDEPLASLDQKRKREILPYLEALRSELEIPIVYVTHSMGELSRLADTVVVLEEGRVVTSGSVGAVLSQLDSPLQQGEEAGVVLEARVSAREERWHLLRAGFVGGEFLLADEGQSVGESLRIRVMARDVSIALSRQRDGSILNSLPATIVEIAPAAVPGALLVKMTLGAPGEADTEPSTTEPSTTEPSTAEASTIVSRITQRSAQHLALTEGQRVWAQIKSMAVLR